MVQTKIEVVPARGRTRRQRDEGDLAQQIQNPLSSVRVLFDIMVREERIAPESRGDVESIQKQLRQIETLVERTLSLSRPDLKAPERKAVDMNTVAHETFSIFVASARSGNRLDLNLAQQALPFCGDAAQLGQVVYNLILNALEAVGKPGRVEVKTGRVSGEDGQPGLILLEVADDGPGIPEEYIRRIGDALPSNKREGAGMGLAIAKRIIEAHQGVFNVESVRRDIGRGTRVKVFLPELFEYQI